MEHEGGKGKITSVVKAQKIVYAKRIAHKLLLATRQLGSKGTFIAKGQPMFISPNCSGTSANLLSIQNPGI